MKKKFKVPKYARPDGIDYSKITKYSEIFPWDEFLERYLINNEEFMFIYKGKEYHFAFSLIDGREIAELNYGDEASGYINEEYDSAEELLLKARIDGKTIKEVWDDFR